MEQAVDGLIESAHGGVRRYLQEWPDVKAAIDALMKTHVGEIVIYHHHA